MLSPFSVVIPAFNEGARIHDTLRRTLDYLSVAAPGCELIVVNDGSTDETATVARRWSTAPCKQPLAMAIDTSHHRLFSGCRSGVMAVSDYQSGKVVATVPIGGDTDDLFFDRERKRVYVVCGEGRVDVLRQESRDRYVPEASIQTAARARTGLFVSEMSKLFVAAPAEGSSPARLLVYQVN